MKPEFEKSKKKKSSIAKPTHRATISEDQVTENSSIIVEEMKWLEQLLDHRLDELDNSAAEHPFSQLPPVAITNGVAPYAVLVRELELGAAERLLLICTLIPHFAPEVLTNKMRDASHPLKVRYLNLVVILTVHYATLYQACKQCYSYWRVRIVLILFSITLLLLKRVNSLRSELFR